MLAGPAAVLVLNAHEVIGHGLVPCFPLLAPLDDQRFADVHVAQEFLAAIGTEALDKLLVLESLDNGLRRLLTGALGLGKTFQVGLGFLLIALWGRGLGEHVAGLLLQDAVGIDRLL